MGDREPGKAWAGSDFKAGERLVAPGLARRYFGRRALDGCGL